MSTALSSSVLETNPYEGHPNLSELEAEVLWQYAKLSQNIKEVRPRLHCPLQCSVEVIHYAADLRDPSGERSPRREDVEAAEGIRS